jgi:hypothetical protein
MNSNLEHFQDVAGLPVYTEQRQPTWTSPTLDSISQFQHACPKPLCSPIPRPRWNRLRTIIKCTQNETCQTVLLAANRSNLVVTNFGFYHTRKLSNDRWNRKLYKISEYVRKHFMRFHNRWQTQYDINDGVVRAWLDGSVGFWRDADLPALIR